ncbi:MAG: ABC transporter ATP-binding protein [Bacilli bacterium]|nr:ABC transporter ATP-binding protein [Bacilli bacterium]
MNILEINQLYKRFGDHEVLKGLDMVVPEHSIFGFIGKNGAGKTTTIKIILGLLKADSGSITVCGEKVSYGETKTNRYIGFLPDIPDFYGYMNPLEYLNLCGEITGLSKDIIKAKSEELLELVGLKNDKKKKIRGFSRGMKQRLGIAQALLNEPKLLICDEPTSALDPIGRKEILDILLAAKGKTTIIFSTHILADVERICDYVGVLHDGKLALSGTLSEIRGIYRHDEYMLEFNNETDAAIFEMLEELKQPSIQIERRRNTVKVRLADPNLDGSFLLNILAQKHLVPLKFNVLEPSLESLFIEVVK